MNRIPGEQESKLPPFGYGAGTRSVGTGGSRAQNPSTPRQPMEAPGRAGYRSYGGGATKPSGQPPRKRSNHKALIIIAVVLCIAAGALIVTQNTTQQTQAPTSSPTTVATHAPVPVSQQQGAPTATSAKPTQKALGSKPATVEPAHSPAVTQNDHRADRAEHYASGGVLQPASESFRLYDASLRWYFSHLTVQELGLFSMLYDGIVSQAAEIILPDRTYTEEHLDHVLWVLRLDCPELVYFNEETAIEFSQSNGYIHSVTLTYAYPSREENRQIAAQVLDAVRTLLTQEELSQDTVHIEHSIYQHIIRSAVYDKDSAHCSAADSVFVHGRGKCSGFSAALTLACRYYGIPCFRVVGVASDASGSDAHSWNCIQVGGEWYLCDPTWDRGVLEAYSDYPAPISDTLRYFNLTGTQLKKSHSPETWYAENEWKLPSCTASGADYWSVFAPDALTGKGWAESLVTFLNEVVARKRDVITLHFEQTKYYNAALDAIHAVVSEWQAATGYRYAYRTISSEESRAIWLFAFREEAENLYRQNNLWVRFFDVGDADAAVVYCEGHYMLIDGGTENESQKLYSFLQQNGISFVDTVIVTHPHNDHAGGLSGALSVPGCSFGVLYSSVQSSDNKRFNVMLEKAEEKGLTLRVPEAGDSFVLGSATVTFVSPDKNKIYENINNRSLVVRIAYKGASFLFTGDAMENAERDMLASGINLSADVLKIGHHGADTSSCQDFLNAVHPSIAIISCGEGNGEHPHPNTIARLESLHCQILRTNECGDITLLCDGSSLQYTKSK